MDSDLKWQPSATAAASTAMHRLMTAHGLPDWPSLWRWSVEHKEQFWSEAWDGLGLIGEKGPETFRSGDRFETGRFFPEGKLNFAENLLRRRDDTPALVFKGEGLPQERVLSFNDLYDLVSRLQHALKAAGVKPGDRVAGWLPNMPEAVAAMLAAASLGAVWSSASPDFGVEGVLDRFGQVEPKILFACDGYFYNGKWIDNGTKTKEAAGRLPSLAKLILCPYDGETPKSLPEGAVSLADFIAPHPANEIEFPRFPFNHPLFILFSSGTTGAPKCIVHGAGGTLLQLMKEHKFHCDMKAGDRVFYFTTCGWMMWQWLVVALASGATLLLYDGAPLYPDGYSLLRFAERHRCTLFGASAKYFDALRTAGVRLGKEYDLASVRLVASTGSPLSPECFDYIYESLFPEAQLASISGGTDIVSCFMLGNPMLPVRRGEIQGPGLGMDIDIFDPEGKPLKDSRGELVCKTPFPSMPLGFWGDETGDKFRKAYFTRFPGVWHHGDWCEWTAHGGLVITGRSDATLNPGGVRIGTAEIYRVVESLPGVKECVAVGQDWQGDVRVVLFVVPKPGETPDPETIRRALREKASPRHVPAKIILVPDIPRTRSGKIAEIAVRDAIHGKPPCNLEALANPESLALYKALKELET